MIKRYFILSLLCCVSSLFSQVEIDKLKLPILVLSEYDSMLPNHKKEMQPSFVDFLGINVQDTLNLNYRKDFGSSEDISIVSDSLSVFVDSENSTFRKHFWPITPPPPPPLENTEFKKLKKKNPLAYEKLMKQKRDSIHAKWEKQFKIESRQHQLAYPIYIFNHSNDKTLIQTSIGGIGKDLYVILEAKDINGNWQPIEYVEQYRFVCGTGHSDYVLNPKSFLIAAIKKYSGEYKTQLRVKFSNFKNTYYSNIFDGYMNYSQFSKQEVLETLHMRFSDRGQEHLEERTKMSFLDY